MLDVESASFKESLSELFTACEAGLPERGRFVTEHELMSELNAQGKFAFLGAPGGLLLLYYKHCLMMHCLYQIQARWLPRQRVLEVSALKIGWVSAEADLEHSQTLVLSASDQKLAEYYEDLTTMSIATEQTVQWLMDDFWRAYERHLAQPEAFKVLGVSPSASWLEVKAAYREKAASAHPDKGGTAEAFIQIKKAYDTLKPILSGG